MVLQPWACNRGDSQNASQWLPSLESLKSAYTGNTKLFQMCPTATMTQNEPQYWSVLSYDAIFLQKKSLNLYGLR